ncbi:uncharacterized protein LOC132542125 [Erinaceus europaeus]|uniref:Uncharacterized protein LOC132542125 n=1 Tax=Erinaceus europaeus TaxID=9365 RepID=A0ABM3YII7_ERIEU|nr:uncharacterized protein LOC132542125 [Erinaceus europaeus]
MGNRWSPDMSLQAWRETPSRGASEAFKVGDPQDGCYGEAMGPLLQRLLAAVQKKPCGLERARRLGVVAGAGRGGAASPPLGLGLGFGGGAARAGCVALGEPRGAQLSWCVTSTWSPPRRAGDRAQLPQLSRGRARRARAPREGAPGLRAPTGCVRLGRAGALRAPWTSGPGAPACSCCCCCPPAAGQPGRRGSARPGALGAERRSHSSNPVSCPQFRGSCDLPHCLLFMCLDTRQPTWAATRWNEMTQDTVTFFQ